MIFGDDGGRYAGLADMMEEILARCNDDPACIAASLEKMEPDLRREILTSDLLNAWQVFWFHFREDPGDEAVEFLLFHPAGELGRGVPMGDLDIFTLTFRMQGGEPEILVADDLQQVGRFRGEKAWKRAKAFILAGGAE